MHEGLKTFVYALRVISSIQKPFVSNVDGSVGEVDGAWVV
jgi:hypothetical protein